VILSELLVSAHAWIDGFLIGATVTAFVYETWIVR